MIKYELVGFNNNINLDTLKYPLYMYIQLTERCNLNCKFCSITNKGGVEFDFDALKKVLLQLKKMNIYDIYYSSGEPLLYSKFREIVNYAYSLGIRQTVLTNGILLDKYEDVLDKIMCVCVSLHGDEAVHDKLTGCKCYEHVIKNIKIANSKTNVKINYTVTADNQDGKQLECVLKFGKKYNISVSFSKYNNVGQGKKNNCGLDLNKFVSELDSLSDRHYDFSVNNCIPTCLVDSKYEYISHGCGAGYLFGCINVYGDVKICPSSRYSVGNIYKMSFKKIWSLKKMRKFRTLEWAPIYCKSCKNLSRCKAGCKAEMEKDILSFNDYNVSKMIDNIWDNIKNKHLKVNISLVRKENESYINLSSSPRKFNHEVLQVLFKINSGVLPVTLEEHKELIVSMYRDKILEVE